MKEHLFSVFTTNEKNSGNLALVISDFSGSDSDMQSIAQSSSFPVTMFILTGKKHNLVRAFYPEMEAPLCIHGALAAAKFLFEENPDKTILNTEQVNGELLQFTLSNKDTVQVKLQKQAAPNIQISNELIKELLNLQSSAAIDVSLPCIVASVGSPKWLIPLMDKNTIAHLQPNFELIKEWSIASGVNGLYVYTKNNEKIVARNFNPKTGILEDSGTGVAAGALALALRQDFVISQGEFIQQPSEIHVTYQNDNNIFVGGKVEDKVL